MARTLPASGDDASKSGLSGVKPIRRGYEQVAEQIRLHIEDGLLPAGTRLPSEDELAAQFGTSRQTVREALRLLAAWNLVRSTVGRGGGTFVSYPDVGHITELIRANVALLTASESVTLESLLEVREFLEIPAAGLAAARHDEAAIESMRRWIVDDIDGQPLEFQGECDIQFHVALLECARNPMLLIAGQPLLHVLSGNVSRIPQPRAFRVRMRDDHRAILAAVEARDMRRAEEEQRRHLAYLRPCYSQVRKTPEEPATEGGS
jgi:DNA-binding FadR family transcriptional regulator